MKLDQANRREAVSFNLVNITSNFTDKNHANLEDSFQDGSG
jgi:hypothetical protein